MITRFSKLRVPGVFRSFDWPSDLDDLSKHNLIYGWNGTGKTTLSKVLRHIELRRPMADGEAVIRLASSDLQSADFGQSSLHIRVFNREFVAESVFPIRSDDSEIPPIFVLGAVNVEKQKKIEELKKRLTRAEGLVADARSAFATAEAALDKHCADYALQIKTLLRSPGTTHRYTNYDKRRYGDDIVVVDGMENPESLVLGEDERDRLITQSRATRLANLSVISVTVPDLAKVLKAAQDLLAAVLHRAAIDALLKKPELESWVRTGLTLHREEDSAKCIFCLNQVSQDRLSALEAHFNEEYEQQIKRLDDCISTVRGHVSNLQEMSYPSQTQLYGHLQAAYKSAIEAMTVKREAVTEWLVALAEKLDAKKTRLHEPVGFDIVAPESLDAFVAACNSEIRSHNETSENLDAKIADARNRLSQSVLAESLSEYRKLKRAVEDAAKSVSECLKIVDDLRAEIADLEREIIEHLEPADELNAELRRYLGHGELAVTPTDTGYQITRNGVAATALSEGEQTAVALLYFLKSLKDRRFSKSDAVVVLDDPVSSLDHNAMFAAFGFMRDALREVGQVIVLTHNFTFFRMVRSWYGHLPSAERKRKRLLMLECRPDASGRLSKIRELDPLLRDFESEYHYLFSQLYALATDPPKDSLEHYFNAPSIARRVLEMFLAFRIPDAPGQGRLWSQMLSAAQGCDPVFEGDRLSRIYRFIQTHSHRDAVGEADEDLTLLSESRSVLTDMLGFMRQVDPDHCSRLIRCVAGNSEDEDNHT